MQTSKGEARQLGYSEQNSLKNAKSSCSKLQISDCVQTLHTSMDHAAPVT